jgi:hypothetical protein
MGQRRHRRCAWCAQRHDGNCATGRGGCPPFRRGCLDLRQHDASYARAQEPDVTRTTCREDRRGGRGRRREQGRHEADASESGPVPDVGSVRGSAPDGTPSPDPDAAVRCSDGEAAGSLGTALLDPGSGRPAGGDGLPTGGGAVSAFLGADWPVALPCAEPRSAMPEPVRVSAGRSDWPALLSWAEPRSAVPLPVWPAGVSSERPGELPLSEEPPSEELLDRLDDAVPCDASSPPEGGPAYATPARGAARTRRLPSGGRTKDPRRRQDHLVTASGSADPRHPPRPVVSGTLLVPDDRTRLPPSNNSRSLVVLHRCEVNRLEHPRVAP